MFHVKLRLWRARKLAQLAEGALSLARDAEGCKSCFEGNFLWKGPPPTAHRCHNHIQFPRSLGWPCFKLVHIRKNVVTQLSRNTIDSKQETTAALYSFKEQSLEAVLTYVDSFWCFYIPACFGRIALWWKTRARSDRRAPLESMQIVWSGLLLRLNAVWYDEGLWVGRGPSWCSFRGNVVIQITSISVFSVSIGRRISATALTCLPKVTPSCHVRVSRRILSAVFLDSAPNVFGNWKHATHILAAACTVDSCRKRCSRQLKFGSHLFRGALFCVFSISPSLRFAARLSALLLFCFTAYLLLFILFSASIFFLFCFPCIFLFFASLPFYFFAFPCLHFSVFLPLLSRKVAPSCLSSLLALQVCLVGGFVPAWSI